MAIKLGRVITYNKELPPIKAHHGALRLDQWQLSDMPNVMLNIYNQVHFNQET